MKKTARRGTGWPAAFEHPLDKKDPYKRYCGPNSGESPKLTRLGDQGLPGEAPDASGSIGGASIYDHESPHKHPWTDFDPDDPFESYVGRDQGILPYGEGGQELNFTTNDGPLSRTFRIFTLMADDNRDSKPEQLSGNLAKKRIRKL